MFKNLDSLEVDLENIRQMPWVVKVEAVFPGQTESSLSRMYYVDVEESMIEKIVADLLQNPKIEGAYEKPGGETPTKSVAEYHDKRPYGWDSVRQTFDYDHPDDDD